jgi:PAS domain S-box-containing protein
MKKTLSKKTKEREALEELDRIAKMLVRRDLELTETVAQLEKQRNEIDRVAKLLVRRDLELTEMREEQVKELGEIDRIAKMLIRRDFWLAEIREKREKEITELDRIAKMLVRRDFELMMAREELEEEKKVLEIKVAARTRELRELAEGLEEKVRERTKDLKKKTDELEESKSALLNILEDVEQARAEAEEERNKTLSVISNLADGLLFFDQENRLALVNPQAEDFFDVKSRDIVTRPILELSAFPTIEPIVRLVGGEIKGVFRKEIQIREDLILEVSTIPIMREEEKLGTLIILHDVTREKMIERMKTEFVGVTAHQLRTPLSAIKWTLRMLLDGDLGKITEEQRAFIEKTYSSNERMIILINDLLNVTRIEEGRYLYKPTLIDIEQIVQSVINSYKEEIKRKRFKFEFEKPKEKLPKVKVDVEKIKLAITNLIDNALRYSLPGGKVTVSLKYVKNEIEFSVKDTGVGISMDQQERIFTKFFRGANAIKMATEGSGLGLFIVKNIIDAHGGKIWFESEEGKGTTFYFSLPVKEESG